MKLPFVWPLQICRPFIKWPLKSFFLAKANVHLPTKPAGIFCIALHPKLFIHIRRNGKRMGRVVWGGWDMRRCFGGITEWLGTASLAPSLTAAATSSSMQLSKQTPKNSCSVVIILIACKMFLKNTVDLSKVAVKGGGSGVPP